MGQNASNRQARVALLLATLLICHCQAFLSSVHSTTIEDPANLLYTSPTPFDSTRNSRRQPVAGRCCWSKRDVRYRRIFSLSSQIPEDYSFLVHDVDSDDDEDDLLSYVPIADEDWDLPPLTRNLLFRATQQYVRGNDTRTSPVQLREVLSVIEQEHDSFAVPVMVANTTYDVSVSGNELDRRIAEVLSFAALYGVPKEIVMILLGPMKEKVQNIVTACQSVFSKQGWSDVSFPKGIGIHVKRDLAKLHGERYPKPRWPWQRRKTVKLAQQLVEDASYAEPPKQRLMSEKDFLKSLSIELTETALPVVVTNENKLKGLAFFPNHDGVLRRVRRSIQRQTKLMKVAETLKTAGRAGTLTYGFLNFAFYGTGILFQWRRLHIGYGGGSFSSSLSKLGRAFGTVYLASQVTKLPRMLLALAMAPFGDRALHVTRDKLGVSEDTAFLVLIASLLGTFFAVITALVLGEAASRKAVPVLVAMLR